MTNSPTTSYQDYPSFDPQNPSFTSTSRLIEFLEIFNGSRFSLSQVEEVFIGVLDFVVGSVVTQNCTQGSVNLEQVQIQTSDEKIYTLTTNKNVALNPNIFDLLGNSYLIIRPGEIWICNLNDFQEKFQEASQFGQIVACAYRRTTGEIILLRILSRHDLLTDDYSNKEFTNLLAGGGHSSSRTRRGGGG